MGGDCPVWALTKPLFNLRSMTVAGIPLYVSEWGLHYDHHLGRQAKSGKQFSFIMKGRPFKECIEKLTSNGPCQIFVLAFFSIFLALDGANIHSWWSLWNVIFSA